MPKIFQISRFLWTRTTAQSAGYLKVEANYQLIVDNLMDLSHIQFLHPYLSDSDWLNKRTVEVDMEGHSVICKNRAKDMKIPPINKFIKPDALPIGETRPRYENGIRHLICLLDVRYITTQDDFHHPIGHIVTPETQSTTHYFFKASRNHRINDGELSHTLRGMFLRAFAEEDQPIIEDQQQSLGSRDLLETKAISLQTDVAALRVRPHVCLSSLTRKPLKVVRSGADILTSRPHGFNLRLNKRPSGSDPQRAPIISASADPDNLYGETRHTSRAVGTVDREVAWKRLPFFAVPRSRPHSHGRCNVF